MNILLLNVDRSSTLALDELLLVWPDRYKLLCAVVSRRAQPALAGLIAERDPEAAQMFLDRLDKVTELQLCPAKRAQGEAYRSPVLSALRRGTAYDILGEME